MGRRGWSLVVRFITVESPPSGVTGNRSRIEVLQYGQWIRWTWSQKSRLFTFTRKEQRSYFSESNIVFSVLLRTFIPTVPEL